VQVGGRAGGRGDQQGDGWAALGTAVFWDFAWLLPAPERRLCRCPSTSDPLFLAPQVARWAYENRMGTLMLQSGELPTRSRLHYLERVVAACREATVAQEMEQRGLDPKVRGLQAGWLSVLGCQAKAWARLCAGAPGDSSWCRRPVPPCPPPRPPPTPPGRERRRAREDGAAHRAVGGGAAAGAVPGWRGAGWPGGRGWRWEGGAGGLRGGPFGLPACWRRPASSRPAVADRAATMPVALPHPPPRPAPRRCLTRARGATCYALRRPTPSSTT
jgi:hypothetical protein